MKAKLTGPVECKLCQWKGQPKDLVWEQDGDLIKCPSCEGTLMDFTNGNFLIQNIKADGLEFSDDFV